MKYLIRVSPVTEQIGTVREAYLRLLGLENKSKVHKLINNGGILLDNLTKNEVTIIASDLMALLAVSYEIKEMESFDPGNDSGISTYTYQVKIIDSGTAKLAVIKAVNEISGLGLKESKKLVENLGVIGIYKTRKEAEQVKRILTAAGATIRIEKLGSSTPKPEPTDPEISSEDNVFVVFGQVLLANQQPVTGLKVVAFDRDLRSEELLGESDTDNNGNYRINYTLTGFNNTETSTANLIMKAFNSVGTLLVESEIFFNVARVQLINLVLTAENNIRPSQYEILIDVITPLLGQVRISELTNEDILFLVKKTGHSYNYIALLADDAWLAARTGMPRSVFWGLGVILNEKEKEGQIKSRQFPIFNYNDLLEMPLKNFTKSMETILEKGLIPAILKDQFDNISTRFEELKSYNSG